MIRMSKGQSVSIIIICYYYFEVTLMDWGRMSEGQCGLIIIIDCFCGLIPYTSKLVREGEGKREGGGGREGGRERELITLARCLF
jgi:hypothetical protein